MTSTVIEKGKATAKIESLIALNLKKKLWNSELLNKSGFESPGIIWQIMVEYFDVLSHCKNSIKCLLVKCHKSYSITRK